MAQVGSVPKIHRSSNLPFNISFSFLALLQLSVAQTLESLPLIQLLCLPLPLSPALHQEWKQKLSQWAADGSLGAAAQGAFRLEGRPAELEALISQWAAGDFSALPPIVLLPASSMPGAAGAYAIRTGTIYLNQDWLAGASAAQVIAVLTEELGHHLDGLLNVVDTPGDEGEWFAGLLTDNNLDANAIFALKNQTDASLISVGGALVAAELAATQNVGASSTARANLIVVDGKNTTLSIELDISEASGFGDDGYGFIGWINLAGPSGQSIYLGLGKADIIAQVNNTATFKKAIELGIATPGGKWYISGINLTDKYGNRRDAWLQGVYEGGTPTHGDIQNYLQALGLPSFDPAVTVVNTGTFVDTSSPTILSLRTSAPIINVINGNSTLSIELDISEVSGFIDDGYEFIGGINLAGPSGQSIYFGLSKADIIAQVNNTVSFRKTIKLGVATPGGKWYISGINLTDKYGNRRDAYLQGVYGGGTPTQSDVQDYLRALGLPSVDPSFTVVNTGTFVDTSSPTILSLRTSAPVINVTNGNSTLSIELDVSEVSGFGDDGYGFIGGINLDGPSGQIIYLGLGKADIIAQVNNTATFRKTIELGVATPGGKWYISGINITDKYGNRRDAWLQGVYDGGTPTQGDIQDYLQALGLPSADPSFTVVNTGTSIDTNSPTVAALRISPDNASIPYVVLTLSPSSVTEDGSANLIYTFSHTGDTTNSLTVNYNVAGSADSADYTGATPGTGKTITFAAGSATAILTINPTDDTTIEANETVALTLAAGTGYSIGTTAAVVGTITNDDGPVITLAVSPAAAAEDGTTNLVYTFTRTGPTSSALTVNYTVGGTATLGTDYTGIAATPATKTITFAAGASTAIVTVDPTADTTIEADETVALTLAAGSGYSIGTTAAVTSTITNDDFPVITLAVSPATVTEDGTTNLIYTFTRTGATTSALTINYGITGTADATDYTGATPGAGKTITFAAGSATAVLTIDPTADTTIEADETVALTLAAGTGYTIGTTAAVTGTITNDDFPVITLAVSPATVTEDGTTNLVYTFSCTGPTTSALTVNYGITGTADSVDFTGATPGTGKTISFAAGSATATLTIDPAADTNIETDETVALTLAAGTGYTIGTTAAVTGTISNDDFPVITLAVSPAAVAEDGTTNLVYTFSRTGPTTSALIVNYGITGTADASDYTGATSGTGKTISFAAGSATATLTIDPTADTTIETDETVTLTLAAGTGYTIGTTAAVTGTITNDDFPVITLAVSPAAVAEDGTTNLIYTFTRTGPTTSALTVNYGITGTADATDYTGATPGAGKTISFAAGSATATLTIDPTADTSIEADETVALTLAAGTGYTIGTTAAVTGTITNDDFPVITLAVAPATVTEDGTTNLIYTFTRTGPTTSALTVNYGITGTADSVDFTGATPGAGKTITFAAGSATAILTIDPTADTTIEADETVALTLAAGTGYTIGTTAAVVGTVTNDDFPVITLDVSPAAVAEDGTTNLIYTFMRTGPTTSALTVNYGITGTADASDYAGATPGTGKTISFAAGSATATLTIDPTADTTIEADETVSLTLATGTGYSIGTTAAVTGTITNDDFPVITLAVAPATVTEDGTTNLVYTFTRTGATTSALTVNYGISGTAAATDYTGATPGTGKTITFAAGSATAVLTIDPTADTTIEADETVALTLAAGTGYTIGSTAAVTGTITNDDFPVITFAVAPATVTEDGTTNLVYTFTRTGPTTSALIVNYGITGTADASDYTGATPGTGKTITFAAGSAIATLTIDPTADTTIEADETVALTLAAGTGYTIGSIGAVTGTISNDDFPVITLDVSPASVTEDGTTNLVYTFTRTGATTSALTVNYGITGTADASDYSGATPGAGKTISFAAGSATAILTIDPTTDTTIEAGETVSLSLAAGTGYTVGTTAAVTGTITNDDFPVITLAVAPAAVTEDGTTNLVYTFTRTGPTTSALTVNYGITGTADASDYSGATPGAGKTISFAAGSATAILTIDPTTDTTIEAGETVSLSLAAGTGYTVGTTAAVTGTITNDDFPVITLAVAPAAVTEDGTANLIYTFSRTGPTSSALSVNYTVGGTATLGTDYTGIAASPATKTVNFTAGSATATVTVDPSADTTIEPDETISLSLIAGTGYLIGTTAAVISTIINDDISSPKNYVLSPSQSSLQLLGSKRINGIGNSLNNVITGSSSGNKLYGLLGADILTGGGTADSDIFGYNSLGESLLGTGNSFDLITDFNNKDFILAPLTVEIERLSSTVGSVSSLASASIEGLLTATSFAANAVAAFSVTGQLGTYIAMNDGRDGFQADGDAVVFLQNYTISNLNFVEFI